MYRQLELFKTKLKCSAEEFFEGKDEFGIKTYHEMKKFIKLNFGMRSYYAYNSIDTIYEVCCENEMDLEYIKEFVKQVKENIKKIHKFKFFNLNMEMLYDEI